MRIIILIVLVYIGYRALRSWVDRNLMSGSAGLDGSQNAAIDDVMVKDPHCETYFPKRSGVQLRHGDEILYFCSTACRNQFKAQQRDSGH